MNLKTICFSIAIRLGIRTMTKIDIIDILKTFENNKSSQCSN